MSLGRLLLAFAVLAPAWATAQSFQGRGVYPFDASEACPLAGVGSLGDHACNRIALDDAGSSAKVDRAAHRIDFTNANRFEHRTIVGDVLWSGWATTVSGARVPVAVHVLVKKSGRRFDAKPHAHLVTEEKLKSIDLEPWTLVVHDGKSAREVVSAQMAREAIEKPGVAARLARELVQVRSGLSKDSGEQDGWRHVGDVVVGVGLGPAADDVLRAELRVPAGTTATSLKDAFNAGRWELRLTALSRALPRAVVQRDLFLYGLEDVPALAAVKRSGLSKGQQLTYSMDHGVGTVRFGSAQGPVTSAANTARAFLEQSFLGAILTEQARQSLTAH